MAAIGFGLALVPEHLWDPLPGSARNNLSRWLNQINHRQVYDDNWYFFRVLVNLGLARVGAAHDADATRAALDRLDEFYLGDGWYSDGPLPQCDYYVAFAMHFYGLLYACLNGERDPARAERFRARSAARGPRSLRPRFAEKSGFPTWPALSGCVKVCRGRAFFSSMMS